MANARLYTNNFTTTTNGAINNSVTSIVVTSTTGLPALSGGDFFYLTLQLGTTVEIVKVTAWSVLTLTVVRAQESTSATSWVSGSVISLNATADSFARKADLASPTFTGTVTLPSGQALIAPTLGTVASGNISACTSTSMVMVTPVLGTPTSGNLSNCTALPTGSITGWGTGVNTFLVTPSSANLLSALTTSTGSGNSVFATSPTLVTPLLGTVTSGNISACTSTSMVMVTPVLGTPTSGNLANCTGYPTSGLDGVFTTEIIIDSTVNAGLGGATSGTHTSTNTAFGAGAFAATTSATGLGVAVGYHAGLVATAPDHCVFIGANSGVAATNTDNTVFVGWGSGAKITTSTGNVAIGADAMSNTSATSSGNNVCVGYQAGRGTGTSQILSCVFIGYQAGSAGASCSNSVGIGNTSLQGATNARNTGVGYNSGAAHTSGTDCCYFGNQAGEITNTGSKITAIGSGSFGSMGAGGGNNNNTGLGYFTGKSGATGGASITTGSGNTFLGARATGTDVATANAIALGQDAVALFATGTTSGTFGPGIAIGSAAFPVGWRGDGTVIPCTAGAAGFWRVKVNGTQYYLPLITDASTTMPSEPAVAGGSNTQVQYNNSSVLGGISGATTDGTTLTLVAPVLGTPASGTLTNCTLPVGGITGLGTGVATFLTTPSSANLLSALTTKTGTGNNVFDTSPTLVTPVLGVASATSLSFSSTSGIIGTTTNDSAASGSVGEIISSTVLYASRATMTTGTAQDVTSISLTAGDWEVFGIVEFTGATTTTVFVTEGWSSSTSATEPSDLNKISTQFFGAGGTVINGGLAAVPIPTQRYSFTTTTSVYLGGLSLFSGSAPLTVFGTIHARRLR